ncbi:MAG TPA: nucleotidyltransferase family protein [Caldisericia bacterium]|nr:nucleotidyltransferase family protein [Caldisericia bacterium]
MTSKLKDTDTNEKLENIIQQISKLKPFLEQHYHIKSIGVFGSFVRKEQQTHSDLDLLAEFSQTVSLLTFIEIENKLSSYLGLKVDLVMKKTLKPRIGQQILNEVVMI